MQVDTATVIISCAILVESYRLGLFRTISDAINLILYGDFPSVTK